MRKLDGHPFAYARPLAALAPRFQPGGNHDCRGHHWPADGAGLTHLPAHHDAG